MGDLNSLPLQQDVIVLPMLGPFVRVFPATAQLLDIASSNRAVWQSLVDHDI